MSADLLRRAASTMRERAEAAQASANGEPWYPASEMHDLIGGGSRNTADAQHIASWHPAVALAVADWLDATADRVDMGRDPKDGGRRNHGWRGSREALAVATAYLNEEQ